MASEQTSALYQEVLLEHNRRPKHFGRLLHPTHTAEGFNPLCGDRYTIDVEVGTDGKIVNAAFEGSGCAISKAAASMMTDAILWKTLSEVEALFEQYHQLVLGKNDVNIGLLGKLHIFAEIWKFPSRIKCAILSWHTLKGALKGQNSITTE